MDPGAVPGSSTKFALRGKCGGAETGSTRVVKVFCGVRNDTAGVYPEGSSITNANDNFKVVAANDNSFDAGLAVAA